MYSLHYIGVCTVYKLTTSGYGVSRTKPNVSINYTAIALSFEITLNVYSFPSIKALSMYAS